MAPNRRRDIDTTKFSTEGVVVFRGSGHTEEYIQEFIEKIGFELSDGSYLSFPWDEITIPGYLSTTLDQKIAYDYAWDNEQES